MMAKAKKTQKTAPKTPPKMPPKRRAHETILWLGEVCDLTPFVKKSYVLSRIWAWASHIEVAPKVRIPVPRFLSVRDP